MEAFDCELVRGGFPAQPVNTVSSAVFVVAALWLWPRHRTAAVAAMAVAVGSVLFHGAPSPLASWVHDVGLYAALAVAAVGVWRRFASAAPPWSALVVAGVGLALWGLSRTGGPLCDPEGLFQGHALWHALAAAALVLVHPPPRPLVATG